MTGDEAWKLWLQYKAERKQTYTKTGLSRLKHFRDRIGDERFVAAVDWSISCNYQGLFEPRNNNLNAAKESPRPSLSEMDRRNDSGKSR